MHHPRRLGWARWLHWRGSTLLVCLLALMSCTSIASPPLTSIPATAQKSQPTPAMPPSAIARTTAPPTVAPPTIVALTLAASSPTLTALPVAFVPPTTTPPLPEPIITADNLTTLRLLRAIGYGHVVDAASAPGGKLLAVATTAGVALFELPTLRHVRFVPLVGGVRQVALSPDGQRLVADTALLRVADGTRLADLTGQTPRFSPDGQLIATLQQDKAPFTIADLATLTTHLWRSADGTSLLTLPGYAAAFSPDGRLLALTTGTSVQLVRLPDGQAVRTLALETSDYVKDLAFSADGQVLRVALVSELQEWRVADGRHTRTQAI